MTIYRLVLVTLCNGAVGDFSLPKTLGYFKRSESAYQRRDQQIALDASKDRHDLSWTTSDDYRIEPVNVID